MINFLTQMPVLDFRSILEIWRNAGIFDIILPFLLIFALVFAILEKSKILGSNRAVYAIISLAISFCAPSIANSTAMNSTTSTKLNMPLARMQ